jgi:hypothetical protein
LFSSTIGGGLVSLTTGGNVTGSTPQKSSVSVAKREENVLEVQKFATKFNEHTWS